VPSALDVKPRDETHLLWDEMTGEVGVGGSMHATLFGTLFVNFAWMGFATGLVMPLLLWGLRSVGMRLGVPPIVSLGVFAYFSFLFGRGSTYNAVVTVIIGLLVLSLLWQVVKYKVRASHSGESTANGGTEAMIRTDRAQ
jgi:hypothetical protein